MHLIHAEESMPEPETGSIRPEGSFAELVAAHSRVLYRIAFTVLRRPSDAEDAVQEAFLAVFQGERWRQLQDPRAYLAQIVWRSTIRLRRLQLRQQELTIEITSRRPGPEQLAIGNDLNQWLQARMDALPETLRLPLALHAAGDLKLTQIAQLLQLPEGTVRRRIHDARQRLRRELAERAAPPPESSKGV
jgi:RNA polymerase sigma-70 factor (ECF subfamily)